MAIFINSIYLYGFPIINVSGCLGGGKGNEYRGLIENKTMLQGLRVAQTAVTDRWL